MKITEDERVVFGIVVACDAKYGKGTTPLLLIDFTKQCQEFSRTKVSKLLASLTVKGVLHRGRWGRSSCWTSTEDV